jgi:uncharacterized protein YjbJ (UPF0337 family)
MRSHFWSLSDSFCERMAECGVGYRLRAHNERDHMADTPNNTDEAKGRVKEAAGNLTGDKDLKNEGKADKASGKLKEGIDKVRDALHKD